MQLYNTLTRKKEDFKPITTGQAGLYTCGPTVYGFPHLGNMRTYIFEDILKRVLTYNDYTVNHVMNITDVGHLTGDRDMGVDKMERESQKTGQTAWEIADFYTKAFKEDLKSLNIIFPNTFCKATDNIPEQIAMIQTLEQKGFTYKISDGIYFDTAKVADYNQLSHQKLEDLREGARVEINAEKKNPTDFALWKFSPTDTKRQMEWKSPWGTGFPGWHIECSAMSVKYLGEQFDIHCGGADHIDIHHTNELAQTESATGKKPWVNYWLHGAFLNIIGGKKMAKSSGDFITVANTFIEKKVSPLVYRFATLSVHYRKPMEWSEESLISAKNGYENLLTKISKLGDKVGEVNLEYKNKFLADINDDLNMAKALATVQELLKSDLSDEDKLATILDFDKVLGLDLLPVKKVDLEIPETVKEILKKREMARQNKDWKGSDELRDEILKLGYQVKDTDQGQDIKPL
jgi:cysteinyl-tRNA synthetase